MKKILIADDEELIRKLVCDFLEREGYQSLQAGDGDEALAVFEENPDTALIILDIMMPNIDGWEACRKIREKSAVPVIMLTARNQEFDELMGFEVGADDYVTKPFSPMVLMKRIAVLLRRETGSKGDIIMLSGLKLDQSAHAVWVDDSSITLTLKEYSILLKLLLSAGRVFSREQLLDDIWGYDFYGDVRTVDSHVARLRTKLGDWGARYIKTIYGMGYKIDENGAE